MRNMARAELLKEWKELEQRMGAIRQEWLDFELTTGDAIEKQRVIHEKMHELRALLMLAVDENLSELSDDSW